jgi:hypothetical protein
MEEQCVVRRLAAVLAAVPPQLWNSEHGSSDQRGDPGGMSELP